MKLSFDKTSVKKIKTDALVFFLRQDKKIFERESRAIRDLAGTPAGTVLDSGDFVGKEDQLAVVYGPADFQCKRLLLVGLGESEKVTLERLRRAAALGAKKAADLKLASLALCIPDSRQSPTDSIVAVAEGAVLALYSFDRYLTGKEDKQRPQTIILTSADPKIARLGPDATERARIICEATALTRDLANAPGNEIYPETLAKAARDCAARNKFKATVLAEREIEKLGMGGVIAVCQGSIRKPRFIELEYGAGRSRPVVLVGKGVTFDTGGISIKPAASMAEMKMDMAGAAAVIGTFEAVSRLKLPVHIVGLIPAVENMPSGSAVKPGDIVRHYGGKTSEVDNTDAEGRLILADALGYAEKFKPAAVIDLATLTGAVVVALGHVVTGMMGNDDELKRALTRAGEKTFERVWELPLYDEYEKLIKSDVADVKNVGGRWAGSITAGWFLKKFVGTYRWAHLDIAGTAILEEKTEYAPRGGSGVGVRLLTEFLSTWKS